MRNIISVIVAGLLLTGCLAKEGSNFAGDQSADTAGNSPPTISGRAPSAVRYGNRYQFTPNASDPDGDPLTFDVRNLPVWATFDKSTGKISGQPTMADLGVYSDILVSVSDGVASTSLPKFSVAVNQSSSGSITLSWVPPTENVDGSPLTDLAGYVIYYGKSSGIYDQYIQIDNPSVSVFVVDNLDSTTYYFSATAFNSSGVESPFSGEITQTVL